MYFEIVIYLLEMDVNLMNLKYFTDGKILYGVNKFAESIEMFVAINVYGRCHCLKQNSKDLRVINSSCNPFS
jgi:hypothetical protein